jgi:hypothetical protein
VWQVQWYENDPLGRKLHYVQGEVQRLDVATITSPDVTDLLTQIGPDLYRLTDDKRLYIIS